MVRVKVKLDYKSKTLLICFGCPVVRLGFLFIDQQVMGLNPGRSKGVLF